MKDDKIIFDPLRDANDEVVSIPPGVIEGLYGLLWLEVTPKCNLCCVHCYAESSPSRQDPGVVDWKKVIRDAKELGCNKVQFIGGEPMLNAGLGEFCQVAKDLDYGYVEVFSNLTLITENDAMMFKELGVHLATSFYSFNKDTHDKITKVTGSFERTVSGIRMAIERKIPLRVGIVKMGVNDKDFKDTVCYLESLGLERQFIGADRMRPVGRGLGIVEFESLETTLCGACWQGNLAVSYDGNVFPCVFSRKICLGNVNEKQLHEILSMEKLKAFRETMYRAHLKKGIAANCYPDDCNPGHACTPDTSCGPCDPNCNPKWCHPDGGGCKPWNPDAVARKTFS
jgi:MoaA/NifB/PqqE/SkfB family radical SAM enzyme